MAASRDENEADRKIYFYRAFPAGKVKDFELDRAAVCTAISKLAGTPDFYLDEGDDRITCAEVVGAKLPPKIKVYGIRRQGLPSRDNGAGKISDLALAANEGLAEAIHLRLYPNSVIAAEFFYYGPRISRVQSFLNERCGQNIIIRSLIRGDAVERALSMDEMRAIRIKLHPSDETKRKASKLGLGGLLDTAKEFDAGVYADVTLRAEKQDPKFKARVKDLLKRLGKQNPQELFESLEVSGKVNQGDGVETLNLLSDLLVREVSIPRESARTRALDSDAAFRAIHKAYQDVKHLLPEDAVAAE